MAQTVLLKRSSVAGNVPGSSDLSLGEIAVNTADGAVYIKKGNNDIVAVADNDILHIDTTNSRVGIGLTNPGAKLQVDGAIVSEGGSFASAQETKTDAGLVIQKNDYIYSDDNNYLRKIIGHTSAGIEIGQGSTTLISDIILKPGTSGNIRFFGSGNEDVRIDSSGNVGIGTDSPGHKLHVVGANNTTPFSIDVGAAASYNFKANSNSTYSTTFNMDADGLTIGHDSAYRELALQTAGTNRLVIAAAGAITFNQAYTFPTADGSANQFLQTDGSGALTFASATVSDISDLTATATELNYLDGVTGITLGSANELLIVGSDGTSIISDSTLSIDTGSNYIGINQVIIYLEVTTNTIMVQHLLLVDSLLLTTPTMLIEHSLPLQLPQTVHQLMPVL
jgi:hypothetical protein